MTSENSNQTQTTLMEALKATGRWSPDVNSIEGAKAYLLAINPARNEAHNIDQIHVLTEILRAAGHGQLAAVVELIKRLA